MDLLFRPVCVLLLAGLSAPIFAQSGAAPAPASTVIHLSTKEVALDVVVRDKRGKIVSDLKPEDIEVDEDGVKQKITSFHFIEGTEQVNTENSEAKAAAQQDTPHVLNTLRQINFVSIVFGPMSPSNLSFAKQAVLSFLKNGALTNTYVTVYRLDTRLHLVQPFSQDIAVLNRAASDATKMYAGKAGSTADTVLSTQSLSTAIAGATAPAGPANNPTANPSLNVTDPTFVRFAGTLDASTQTGAAAQAQASLENRNRFVQNYATGMTMIDSINDLVRSQSRLQGRKVVLYLSDGLTLPQDRQDAFSKLVSDANRSGVTFYTVDTRGLSIDSPMTRSTALQNQIAGERSLQGTSLPGTAQNISTGFDTGAMTDDVQLQAVSNTQLNLRALAERTGGFATANTNEISSPMQRVMEDIRTHYQLAYTPTSDVYDGHFRRIDVKLDRPKLLVQARRGYYALPELNGEPLQQFEMTALKAINTRPLPQAFPFKTALMQFRPDNGSVQCEMFFEIPFSSLSLEQDPKTGNSRMHASVFALVQDANGQVIDKISRELIRDIPAAQIASLKDEKIEYAEPIELAPGRYMISTAVSDQKLDRTTVKRLAEFIDPVGPLHLSSVEIVKRVDRLQAPRNPLDPLEMDDRRVTLTSAENVAAGRPVPLYFVLYPSPESSPDPLKLTLQLFLDGKEVARTTPELPKPDSTGAIPIVAQLSPPPGSYDLRVTAQQGKNLAQIRRTLTVDPTP